MAGLRDELVPGPRDPERVARLEQVIGQIVDALETGAPTDALMAEHNRLCGRSDIPTEDYRDLHNRASEDEAAEEAMTPEPRQVTDLTRDELDDIARRIVQPEDIAHQPYYLRLFQLNTPFGSSDLFFWPPAEWLAEIGTDEPTPTQYVEKALKG